MYIAVDIKRNIVDIEDAVPGKDYFCPACTKKLIAKRGEVRHHYFAHAAGEACIDTWDGKYDLSEWHRDWQAMFPTVNQEVVVQLGDVKHRADILTGKTVIEFQHSPLSNEDFNKRNSFYRDLGYKVVWLFDLSGDYENGKLVHSVIGGNTDCFEWRYRKSTFCRYDIEKGAIELFFQIKKEDENCIIKIEKNGIAEHNTFCGSQWLSKNDFLNYFGCTNGNCPEPFRQDIAKNDDYRAFKHKYEIILDPQQERAIETIEGANLILAVPGSGKTTVLITRIGYMVNCKHIPGNTILALTYTKKAASEMKERYAKVFGANSDIEFRTINSLASEILVHYDKAYQIATNAERSTFLKSLYTKINDYEFASDNDVKMAETTISCIKNRMLSTEEISKLDIWGKSASEVYEKYQEWLNSVGKIDYDDQLVMAFSILKNHRKALSELQNRFKYVCVDEAQDNSKIQYELIKLIASRHNNIFMVGDEDQSIYAFRAAYPEALINFRDEYPNPFILQLETNYRSNAEIVDLSSTFIAKNEKRYPKKMHSYRGSGDSPSVISVNSREEQYQHIVSTAENAKNQTAFLYRENSCVLPIIDRLLKKEIPFKIKKPEEIYFFNEHVVNDIKAFFKLAINPYDQDAFKQIYYKCNSYIRKADLKGICGRAYYQHMTILEAASVWYAFQRKSYGEVFKRKIEAMQDMRPADAIKHICDNGYEDYLREKGRGLGHIEILIALASDDETLSDFLIHLDHFEKDIKNLPEDESNIIFSTVHSSKGLEYDTVYLFDVFEGMFPAITTKGTREDQIEMEQEERRLFYVAMTRAKNSLFFYNIADRKSQFISELFSEGKPIQELIELSRKTGDNIVFKNLYNMKTYMIGYSKCECLISEIDCDTGEILKGDCFDEIRLLDRLECINM